MKNFDFHNDMKENILSQPCISYIANETLQGEEEFNSKNYFLEMLCFHAQILLKSAPQKLNFIMRKAKSTDYTRL